MLLFGENTVRQYLGLGVWVWRHLLHPNAMILSRRYTPSYGEQNLIRKSVGRKASEFYISSSHYGPRMVQESPLPQAGYGIHTSYR